MAMFAGDSPTGVTYRNALERASRHWSVGVFQSIHLARSKL